MSAILAAVVVLLAPAPAGAQDVAEARRLFERGVALADQELWAEAADAFGASLAIVRRPNTLYNLGNALYRTGRHVEAIEILEEYQRVSDAERDAARRAEAQRMLGISRRSVVTLTLRVAPPAARVTVDGALVEGEGNLRRLLLNPGQRQIRVIAEGFRPSTLQLAVTGGQELDRRVALEAEGGDTAVIRVSPTVRDAITRIDGRVIGEGRVEQEIDAGRHEVVVSAEDHLTLRRTLDLAPGESVILEATLTPEPEGTFVGSAGFWVLTSTVVVGVTAAVLAVLLRGTEDPYGGTANVVLMGLSAP